jgi:RNA ligase
MFYQFPIINSFSDIEPYIGDSITVTYKDDYIVVNYNVADKQTFPDLSMGDIARYRREMRGIIFDANTKKVLRRPFHKFFNLNEREEESIQTVDFKYPHVILDKLDGSMVTPLMTQKSLRYATKAGITDMSVDIESYVHRNKWYDYDNLCHTCIAFGKTPIFEYMSPKTRIVIDYGVEYMDLLAIRDNRTGRYDTYEEMTGVAKFFKVPHVAKVDVSTKDIKTFVESIYNASDIEGVVVRFNSGHMLKVKTEWYVNIHRAKDQLLHEKNVIELILDQKIDDVIPYLLEDDKKKLYDFMFDFEEGIKKKSTTIECELSMIKTLNFSRKEFATSSAQRLDSLERAVFFMSWDKPEDARKNLETVIKKNLGSQTKVDNARYLWNYAKWKW